MMILTVDCHAFLDNKGNGNGLAKTFGSWQARVSEFVRQLDYRIDDGEVVWGITTNTMT